MGDNKIENRCTVTVGRLDRTTFTFEYPVESNVIITYRNVSDRYSPLSTEITKGDYTKTVINADVNNNPIISITPSEDDKYIYTW